MTAYTNPLGSDYRVTYLTVTTSAAFTHNDPSRFVDGGNATFYFNASAVSGLWIQFDFGSGNKFVIDEATWTQSSTASHGAWKWQGSDNATDWTDIGGSFTLGGATSQVQTQLNGNTTSYRYYRLLGLSGNLNTGPYLYELNFKIGEVETTGSSYLRVFGTGARTGIITATADIAFGLGKSVTLLINGNPADSSFYFDGGAVANKYIKFDFGTGITITEAAWFQSLTNSHGSWKWQGSANDSDWSDIGSAFTLGGAATQLQTELNGNTIAYRYYRLLGISGNASNTPVLYEIDFKINPTGEDPIGSSYIPDSFLSRPILEKQEVVEYQT